MLSEKKLFDAYDMENNNIVMNEYLNNRVVSKMSIVSNKRKKYHAYKIGKVVIAICMIITLVLGLGNDNINMIKDNSKEKEVQTNKNPFSIFVSANELLEEGNEKAEEYAVNYYSLGTKAPEYYVDVNIQFPVEVKGESIKSITYTISNGVFVMYEPVDEDSLIIEGKKGEYNDRGSSVTSFYSKKVSTKAYESFTVDYNRQVDKNHIFTIARSTEQLEGEQADRNKKIDYLQKYIIGDEQPKAQVTKEFLDLLFEDCVIECKVNFEDGTSQTRNILLHNTIPDGYSWTVYQYFTIQ